MNGKPHRRTSTAARGARGRTSGRVTQLQRRIQRQVARSDRQHPAKKFHGSMQAGARAYPEPPLPAQHKAKPGRESQIDPPPMYDAPYYLGSGKLQEKVALITGADSGIGRAVAVLFAREGADIVIQYLAEDTDADVTLAAVEREGRHAIAIKGDVRRPAACTQAVEATIKRFGHLDVLVNNAAFQVHSYRLEDLSK